ncbi:MAG TPA: hypothetical protein VMQ58_01975 [Candidatus Saccharimonadales bacterium]|nr:hypothetical protein [Candidatus Saccharimonadales bacterium]
MFKNRKGQMWIIYGVMACLSFIIWLMVSPMLSAIIEGTLSTSPMGGVTDFIVRLILWVGIFFGLYNINNAIKGIGK